MQQHYHVQRQRSRWVEYTHLLRQFWYPDEIDFEEELQGADFNQILIKQRKTVCRRFSWQFYFYFLLTAWLLVALKDGFIQAHRCDEGLYWLGVYDLFLASFATQALLILFVFAMFFSRRPKIFWRVTSTALQCILTFLSIWSAIFGTVYCLSERTLKCRTYDDEINRFWVGCAVTTFCYAWVFSIWSLSTFFCWVY